MPINLPSLLRAAADLVENEDVRRRFLARVRTLSKQAAIEVLTREGAPAIVIEHVRQVWPD